MQRDRRRPGPRDRLPGVPTHPFPAVRHRFPRAEFRTSAGQGADMRKTLAAHTLALLLSVSAAPAQAGAYEFTFLGTFGGTSNLTYDINNHDQVVGVASAFFNDNFLPATWKGSPVPINLEMFGGPQGTAYAINN